MSDELAKELEEMTNLLTANTEPPSTEAPGTEAPGTEVPGTDAPGTEAPTTEAPGTEAPTTEAPSEIAEMKATIAELRELIKQGQAPKTNAPSTNAPGTEASISEEDFLADTDLDDLTRDPSAFNKLLNSVYKKALDVARAEARSGQEKTLQSIPEIVKTNIVTIRTLKDASDKFYEENKDLEPFKKVVALVFEEEASKRPGESYDKILAAVGPEVRNRLDLKKKATNPNNKDKPPKLPKRKSQQRVTNKKPPTDSIQAELLAMDEALGL